MASASYACTTLRSGASRRCFPRERAALEWTEALTQLAPHGVSDAVYSAVREQFSEQEISDLSFLVVAINGWNRLNVAVRAVPGTADKAFGLDKSNLA